MLHAKFHDHRTLAREEDLLRFSPYIGMAAICHVTLTNYINFGSRFPWKLHMKFGFDWPSGDDL